MKPIATLISLLAILAVLVHAEAFPDPAAVMGGGANNQQTRLVPPPAARAAHDPAAEHDTRYDDTAEAAQWSSAIPFLGNVINLVGSGDRYIIRLRDDIDTNILDKHVEWLKDQLGTSLPIGHLLHKYDFGPNRFHGYAGTFHPLVVQVLRQLPIVHSVERDQEVSLNQAWVWPEETLVQSNVPWNLARVWQSETPMANPTQFKYWSRAGRGVDAYILDSGISEEVTDYTGRVIRGVETTTDISFNDTTGHGSHVASLVGGTRWGIAKGVTLYNVKVLNSRGSGTWSGIIAGVNWAVSNAQARGRPSVINMSISGPVSSSLNWALKSAVDAGIHVVVAAGNSATDACTTSPASAMQVSPGIHVVGAVNQWNRLSGFSNFGPCVTILAPGESIQAARANTTTGSVLMSGTSMAAPATAGVVASILAQVSMRPDRLVRYIQNTATVGAIMVDKPNTTARLLWLNSTQVFASDVIART